MPHLCLVVQYVQLFGLVVFVNHYTFYNNDYLFSVTYFDKKINIEIFHSLTDGNGGLIFFREIIYNYLDLKHVELQDKEERKARKIEFDTEDSYVANYDKKSKKDEENKAYHFSYSCSCNVTCINGMCRF